MSREKSEERTTVTDVDPPVDLDGQDATSRIGRYATEAIGTFFLMFTIGCAVLVAAPLAPLAIGSMLMVMIFAGGHISGAHFNPAVTLGVVLRGRMGVGDLLPYWSAQLVGSCLGALSARFVTGLSGNPEPLKSFLQAIAAEYLVTLALVWVVLNVATAKNNLGNGFYGLAIGFTVLAGAVAVGGISGGAFNPAVGIGAALLGLATWQAAAVYWIAPLAGGATAALLFRVINPADR